MGTHDRARFGKENWKEMDLEHRRTRLSYEATRMRMRQTRTYREIDDKRFSEHIYGSDSSIGNATIVKPEPCTDAAMHELTGQSPNTASPIYS